MLSALSKYAERFFSKLLVHESWLKYHSDEAVIIAQTCSFKLKNGWNWAMKHVYNYQNYEVYRTVCDINNIENEILNEFSTLLFPIFVLVYLQ